MRRTAGVIVAALLCLALLPSLISCKPEIDSYHAHHGIPACEITAPFDSLFTSIFKENEPGAIIIVLRGDTVVYDRAIGLARLDSVCKISDSTIFNLASASKLFTSVALLKLAEENMLSIDDTLSKYFPELHNDFFGKITIRHILNHSSGLPDLRPRNISEWDKYIATHNTVFGDDPAYRLYGREKEHMQVFQNLEAVEFEPGTHYQRQDPSYILVAPLIERVTGTDFDQWMADNMFKPYGIDDIFYFNPDIRFPRTAHGYQPAQAEKKAMTFRSEDGRWDEADYNEVDFFLSKADRGAYASAKSFMKWTRALAKQKIISDSSMKIMNTPAIPTDIPNVSFGLGNAICNDGKLPVKAYHMNNNGGFRAIEAYWPERDLHYAIFSNRNDWNERAVLAAVDTILHRKGWI